MTVTRSAPSWSSREACPNSPGGRSPSEEPREAPASPVAGRAPAQGAWGTASPPVVRRPPPRLGDLPNARVHFEVASFSPANWETVSRRALENGRAVGSLQLPASQKRAADRPASGPVVCGGPMALSSRPAATRPGRQRPHGRRNATRCLRLSPATCGWGTRRGSERRGVSAQLGAGRPSAAGCGTPGGAG